MKYCMYMVYTYLLKMWPVNQNRIKIRKGKPPFCRWAALGTVPMSHYITVKSPINHVLPNHAPKP